MKSLKVLMDRRAAASARSSSPKGTAGAGDPRRRHPTRRGRPRASDPDRRCAGRRASSFGIDVTPAARSAPRPTRTGLAAPALYAGGAARRLIAAARLRRRDGRRRRRSTAWSPGPHRRGGAAHRRDGDGLAPGVTAPSSFFLMEIPGYRGGEAGRLGVSRIPPSILSRTPRPSPPSPSSPRAAPRRSSAGGRASLCCRFRPRAAPIIRASRRWSRRPPVRGDGPDSRHRWRASGRHGADGGGRPAQDDDIGRSPAAPTSLSSPISTAPTSARSSSSGLPARRAMARSCRDRRARQRLSRGAVEDIVGAAPWSPLAAPMRTDARRRGVTIGVDVVELSRMRAILERTGEAFLRAFSRRRNEPRPPPVGNPRFLASAFAAKEAVFDKALAD